MRTSIIFLVLLGFWLPSAYSADYLRDRTEVHSLLQGRLLHGIYLRTGSEYTLDFVEDGTLLNSSGAEGRWWVNDSGQYCREWLSGRLKGNEACLDIVLEDDGIAIHSQGRKVAEGRLTEK